jgi:colicin import membrane protein
MTSKKKPVAKATQFTETQNQEVLKKASTKTIESVVGAVTQAQVAISNKLSEVNAQLQTQLTELNTVSQAVEIKKAELESVYSKEAVLKNIDELGVDYEARKQAIETEEQETERQRAQESADFTFDLQQSRKNEQVQYEESLRLKKASQRDQDELREKNYLLREEGLKKQENEIVELRAKVAAFPTELDAAVKKAEAIVGNTVKRDYEHKLQLLQKDFDTAKTVSDGTIRGLHERLAANDKVIVELTLRLTSAEERVTTIATKALEAASSTKSLADVQNLIQTQNNGSSARKT